MKLREFSIVRYGPLAHTGRLTLEKFNLFWGKNEQGKTLTIDALMKLLLGGKKLKKFKFEGIDRVEEEPEGYVVVEGADSEEVKLPEKGKLTELISLTPSVYRNIFVIRNSDLKIESEGSFYTEITDHLTGLKTERISRIKKEIQDIGMLIRADSQSDFSNSKKYAHISSRLKKAGEMIERIDSLQQKIRERGLDKLEEEYVKKNESLKIIKEKLEILEEARMREDYEKGKSALDKLKQALQEIKDLEVYTEKDEQLWKDSLRNIAELEDKKIKLNTEIKQKREVWTDLEKKWKDKQRAFKVLKQKRDELYNYEIKGKLNKYERKAQELARKEGLSRFFYSLGIIFSVLLAISVVGFIFKPSSWLAVLGIFFFFSFMLSVSVKFKQIREKGNNQKLLEEIKSNLYPYELEASSVKEIKKNLQQMDEEYNTTSEELSGLKAQQLSLQDTIYNLKDKQLPSVEKSLKDNKNVIAEIKDKSGEEEIEEYRKKLNRNKRLEAEIDKQKNLLMNFFGQEGSNLKECIPYWEEKIKELSSYRDRAKNLDYDGKKAEDLREKRKTLTNELEGLQIDRENLRESLQNIEKEANQVLQLQEERLPCETYLDLEGVKKRLYQFREEKEKFKQRVFIVMKIFEDIDRKEKEKVSQLFGESSAVSTYFCHITEGLYTEVNLNPEKGLIEVNRNDGKVLEASQLSAGAYDQLYFSIRLALGEKILKDRTGFFIMDDPFIKADRERLNRQLEMLKKISQMGWQILYFTAKQEVREALWGDIQQNSIKEIGLRTW